MNKLFEKSLELARALYPASFEKFGNKRCFHYTAVFNKTKLVTIAENKPVTHPRNIFNLKSFDVGLKNICSELKAFLKVKSKLENPNWDKLTIINVRIDREGKIRNSCPCKACKNLLRYISPKNVFYSNDAGEFEEFKIN